MARRDGAGLLCPRNWLEVAACQDWTLIPPASTSPSPAHWRIVFLKALGEGFLQGCMAGFPFAKAACPLPSRSVLHVYLLVWISVDSPSSSWADSRAHLHPQSFSWPMGAALAPRSFWGTLSLPWGRWPAALPGCAPAMGPASCAPCVVCRAEGPHCAATHPPATAITPLGRPRAQFVHIYYSTHTHTRRQKVGFVFGFFSTIDLVL